MNINVYTEDSNSKTSVVNLAKRDSVQISASSFEGDYLPQKLQTGIKPNTFMEAG